MKLIAIAAAAAVLMLGTAAHAQQKPATAGLYGEVGYTQLRFSGSGSDVKPGMIRGIIGYDFHPNAAVEGMLGFGIKDDEVGTTVAGTRVNVKAEVRNMYGLFVKPKFNATNELELFGRLGYVQTRVKATATAGGVSASNTESDHDWAYGAGLNYRFTPAAYVGVDYMSYFNKNGGKIDGWTIGVGYRF